MIVHTMGTLLPTDNDRFTYLANLLIEKGENVEIVTSDFEHHKKKYRDFSVAQSHPFKITFLHENEYKKNISFKRISGHISFANNLKEYLEKRKRPDVIYCAIPPTVSACNAAKYAKKNNIRFVIDVQDLWPESFVIALGNNLISKIVLKPIAHFANAAYAQANEVVAVSETYINRAMKNNNKATKYESVYLGTDEERIGTIIKQSVNVKENASEFWIAYVGNIGKSYDFLHLFQALEIVRNKGIDNMKLYILGDGNLRDEVENLSKKYYPDTVITGYLSYDKMMEYLLCSDIAVNPIVKGTFNSVVNKVGDYAAAGIPVINTQDNLEYRNLVEEYDVGFNTIPESAEDMADKIIRLYSANEIRRDKGNNNRRLFEEKFNRKKTYLKIVECILRDN